MATLQITVFEGASMVALGDPIQEETVTFTGTSGETSVITGSGRIRRKVRVFVDADAWVHWGDGVKALTDGTAGRMMAAETEEYFDIESGHVVSAIART